MCIRDRVVRREEDGIRRYVHLGTGNYNDSTAKLYTDCGLFTCNSQIGEDATAVFNMLSGYSEPLGWNKLAVAPLWLRNRFLRLIERETKHAAEGKEAHIIAKMNSLCDKEIIASLYQACLLYTSPFIYPAHVTIEFGKPFIVKELEPEQRKFAGAYTRSVIIEMLKAEMARVSQEG